MHLQGRPDMEPTELRAWMERNGKTVSGLALELGISRTQLHRYLRGATPIPRPVELALEALKRGAR